MALNGNTMGSAIATAVVALSQADKEIPEKVWQAVATKIVEHLIANATITVTSVTGVTPGGGASGPGTATIS